MPISGHTTFAERSVLKGRLREATQSTQRLRCRCRSQRGRGRRSPANSSARVASGNPEQFREVGAGDPVDLLGRERRENRRSGFLVHIEQLLSQRNRLVEETRVVRPEEQLVEGYEHRLTSRQQQEEVASCERRDQVRQLRVK